MNLTTRKYTDVDLSFGYHPVTGDIQKRSYENAVKQSIRVLIASNIHDKPFHPEVRCGVRKYLFEPMNNITQGLIKKSIEDVLEYFEPRVILNKVDVIPIENRNTYQINILYSIVNNPDPVNTQELELFLERLR